MVRKFVKYLFFVFFQEIMAINYRSFVTFFCFTPAHVFTSMRLERSRGSKDGRNGAEAFDLTWGMDSTRLTKQVK